MGAGKFRDSLPQGAGAEMVHLRTETQSLEWQWRASTKEMPPSLVPCTPALIIP